MNVVRLCKINQLINRTTSSSSFSSFYRRSETVNLVLNLYSTPSWCIDKNILLFAFISFSITLHLFILICGSFKRYFLPVTYHDLVSSLLHYRDCSSYAQTITIWKFLTQPNRIIFGIRFHPLDQWRFNLRAKTFNHNRFFGNYVNVTKW